MKKVLKQNKSSIIDLMKITHYKGLSKDDLRLILLGGNENIISLIVNDGTEKILQASISLINEDELEVCKADDKYVAVLTSANKLEANEWTDQSVSEEAWQDLLAECLVFLIAGLDPNESAPTVDEEDKKRKKEEKFNRVKNKLKS